jgi:hypothetical protein
MQRVRKGASVSTREDKAALKELPLLAPVDREKSLKRFLLLITVGQTVSELFELTNERRTLLQVLSSTEQG